MERKPHSVPQARQAAGNGQRRNRAEGRFEARSRLRPLSKTSDASTAHTRRRFPGASRGGSTLPALARIARIAGTAVCLAGFTGLGAATAQANPASAVYRFVDDRGVVHFSNAPADRRYELVKPRPQHERNSAPTRARQPIPVHHGYDSLIVREAHANDLEPALVKAVIAAESNFSRFAVSRAGAQGLMQLMPQTAAGLGVDDPFHERQNVNGGSRYLRAMLDRYGDLKRALAAYNAGPSAVDRYRGIPPYPETKAYVKRVLAYYRGYQGDFHR